jgi:hypothetical protein
MKKQMLLIVFFLLLSKTYGQPINIPDANFKTYLLNYVYQLPLTGNWQWLDDNHNSEIEPSEAQTLTALSLENLGISDLTGIEYFVNLQSLYFSNNSVSTLNTNTLTHLTDLTFWNNNFTSINLTPLVNLVFLGVSGNNFTALNLSGLLALKSFNCDFNPINSLDLSGNPALESLFCSDNNLTTLNFSANPNFKILHCYNNQINTLDLSQNPLFIGLKCANNNLTSINIKNNRNQNYSNALYYDCWKTGNPNLTNICVDASEQVAVQSYLDGCGSPQVINISSTCALANEGFVENQVTVSPNPATTTINVNCNSNDNSNMKMMQLLDLQGRVLTTQEVAGIIATFDVSGYDNGVYFIKITTNNKSSFTKIIKN